MARLCRSRGRSRGPRRTQRGAAAVESALVIGAILAPLLLGTIDYGRYFWIAQKADAYAIRIPEDGIVGEFTCAELAARVKALVAGHVVDVGDATAVPVDVDDIVVRVVHVLPEGGAVVEVSVTVSAVESLTSLVPMPSGGAIVVETTTRLQHVKVATGSC